MRLPTRLVLTALAMLTTCAMMGAVPAQTEPSSRYFYRIGLWGVVKSPSTKFWCDVDPSLPQDDGIADVISKQPLLEKTIRLTNKEGEALWDTRSPECTNVLCVTDLGAIILDIQKTALNRVIVDIDGQLVDGDEQVIRFDAIPEPNVHDVVRSLVAVMPDRKVHCLMSYFSPMPLNPPNAIGLPFRQLHAYAEFGMLSPGQRYATISFKVLNQEQRRQSRQMYTVDLSLLQTKHLFSCSWNDDLVSVVHVPVEAACRVMRGHDVTVVAYCFVAVPKWAFSAYVSRDKLNKYPDHLVSCRVVLQGYGSQALDNNENFCHNEFFTVDIPLSSASDGLGISCSLGANQLLDINISHRNIIIDSVEACVQECVVPENTLPAFAG